MTTSTVTAQIKGDRQHYVEGEINTDRLNIVEILTQIFLKKKRRRYMPLRREVLLASAAGIITHTSGGNYYLH